MARIAVGAITISDIADGVNPLSAILSNQSHTFATDTTGNVATAEKTAFDCEVLAFVGDTRAVYSATLASNNTFRLDTYAGRSSGWGLTNTSGKLTMNTTPTGTGNKSEIFDIVMAIKNSVGNVTVVTLVLSVTKAIEGTGGAIITMNPSRQTFQFAEGAVLSTGADIVIPVSLVGNVGALSVTYSKNGEAWAALNVGSGANYAKALSVTDNDVDDDTITISKDNFGNSDTFAVRVIGAAGGIDVTSIVKIQDGNTGPASLFVSITSSDSGFAFKNNTGTAKVLTATVYDMASGSIISPTGISYQWKHDGTTTSDAASGSTVMSTTKTQTVTFSMIDNNSSNEITCEVSID
jgi:hypothetical protein